ncbi:MAG: tetratricopeptide repeat protein [Candidatus Omnitrophica bacterium]|nr:tetratricopeptide repeat protein [Candidatus Omnitrophota bacterium]
MIRIIFYYLLVLWFLFPGMALAQTSELELLSAARQAFNDGFNDVAKGYLEDFLSKYPQSPQLPSVKLLLGQCDFLKGQYSKALDLFEQIGNQKDKQDEILYWRAEALLKEGRFLEAKQDYLSVITRFPQSSFVPQAYYSLGWAYFQDKEFTSAKQAFGQLIMRFPSHQLAEDAAMKIAVCDYNAGQLKEAIRDFQSFGAKYPKSTHLGEVNFNAAESFYYLGDFKRAVDYYQKAIDLLMDENLKLSSLVAQGWCYMKLSRMEEARVVLKKADNFCKAKNLSAEDVVLARAHLAYERGLYDEALGLFSDFIQNYPQNPHWPQGYLGRANVYYLMKKYEQAKQDYLRLETQKDPEIFVKSRLGLGWCAWKLGQRPDSLKYFQEVFDKSTDIEIKANALIQMADVYQENHEWEAAVTFYERVKKSFSSLATMDYVYYRQSIALLKWGKSAAAMEGFKILRARFPQSKFLDDVDYYMGLISFKKSDWGRAGSMMEHYLKSLTRPSSFAPDANYILALSFLNLKQPEEALKVFQKILRLYPNDISIAKNADIGIAKCQFELGQGREAVKRFKFIVYKYPYTDEAFEAMLWLAQHYLKNGDIHSAIEYYKLMIDEFSNSKPMDQIRYELGQAYELQGKSDDALQQYKAISDTDESLKGKTRLAIAGIMFKEMDPKRAIGAYQSIIATSPDYAGEAYLKLGQLYRGEQNYEKELEVYQKALASKEGQIDRAQIQFNLADTLELMSRAEDAIAAYLKIPDLYPNEGQWVVKAYLRVAKMYEEDTDWEGARVTYQKIIQLNTPEAVFAKERLEWIKNNAGKMR